MLQARPADTSLASLARAAPNSCLKFPMTSPENPQVHHLYPAHTHPWTHQATYVHVEYLEVALFMSSPPHSGSISAESCTAYRKQHIWSRHWHAWHLGKLESRFRLAGPCGSLTPSPPIYWSQVWGGGTPSQRNVSASSAPASTDPLSNQAEMSFRPNMTEGWRSSSGTWADDDAGEFSLVSLRRGDMVPE
jgi:hypothetical protein